METAQEVDFLTILVPLAGIILIITVGVILMYLQFQRSIFRQELANEELKSLHQKQLLQRTIEVQEQERKRIAMDLHDELGAILSISRMQLLQLESQDEISKEDIGPVRDLIENTLASTRRISHELMPLQLEKLGLENALLSLLTKAKESGEIESNIAISESCDELPWMVELGLYRIFSELINNTIKHADATTIEISILLEDGQLFCRYSDNGKGINLDTSVTGLGMQSVENRIDALQGSWEYGDRSSGGFFARIRIPLNK